MKLFKDFSGWGRALAFKRIFYSKPLVDDLTILHIV